MGVFTFRSLGFVAILSACGAADMPDSGLTPSTTKTTPTSSGSNGEVKTQGGEATFDLAQCGFNTETPTVNLASRRMNLNPFSLTVNVPILGGILTSQQKVTFSGQSILEDSLAQTTMSFSAQGSPAVNSTTIQSMLGLYNSGLIGELMAPSERKSIGAKYPDWKGVFCSLQPVVKIQKVNPSKVTFELDKPMPLSPLTISGSARIKAELSVKRLWSGIGVKVTSSSDSAIAVGASWTGKVEMTPINPTTSVEVSGQVQNVQGDIAVKMLYDFGSLEANKALGLPKTISWYMDSSSKHIKLMSVDFGDGQQLNYLIAL